MQMIIELPGYTRTPWCRRAIPPENSDNVTLIKDARIKDGHLLHARYIRILPWECGIMTKIFELPYRYVLIKEVNI